MDFVANFNLENPTDIDATFQINVAPSKVSQLENDLNFQTADEVAASIQAESDIINARIDDVSETLSGEIQDINNRMIDTIVGNDLLDISKEGNTVTITPKTYVFEQGIASDTWIIEHNLNKNPVPSVVDSAGRVQIPNEVTYDNRNQITISLLAAFTGKAYLN